MKELRDVVKKVREIRAKFELKRQDAISLYIMNQGKENLLHRSGASELLQKAAGLSAVHGTDSEIQGAQSFLGLRDRYFLQIPIKLDVEAEKEKLRAEIAYEEGFIASVNKKLDNPKFVESAPPSLVEKERKKLEDGMTRMNALKDRLNSL